LDEATHFARLGVIFFALHLATWGHGWVICSKLNMFLLFLAVGFWLQGHNTTENLGSFRSFEGTSHLARVSQKLMC
jgi:hypothetical protein